MLELTYVAGAQRSPAPGDERRTTSVMVLGENIRNGVRPETAVASTSAFAAGRVLDMPISEAAFTGFANGAAMAGHSPGGGVPGLLPHLPRLRPDREPGREAPPDARRAGEHPHHVLPHGGGRGRREGRPALRQPVHLPGPRRHQDGRAGEPPPMPRASCSPRSSRTTRSRSSSTPTSSGRRATCRPGASVLRSRGASSGGAART